MKVYYRLCGIASTNPSPIYQDDKYKLNELCYRSFIAHLDQDVPIHIIADQADTKECERLVSLRGNTSIIHTDMGINDTCLYQYSLAKDCADDEVVLFQECDYFYNDEVSQLEEATKILGLCSPYDHLNFYQDSNLHSDYCQIKLINNHHWRSVERNTMTFAIRGDLFKKYYDIFYQYGYLDGDVWYDLLDAGQTLWTPIPSIATHMVKNWLAPTIDWKTKFAQYEAQI